jgi:RNA polymerase sigma-70 factor (ECF subfamily)
MKRDLPGRPTPEDLFQYRPQLLRFATQRLRDPCAAEDAVQETFAAAIEGIDRFGGDSSLRTWLTGILRHKIVDCVRQGRRDAWEPLPEEMAADGGDPEGALARGEFIVCLQGLLEILPAAPARVFVLREVLGRGVAETCDELDLSSNHCHVLLHRARARLRLQLASRGYCAAESL